VKLFYKPDIRTPWSEHELPLTTNTQHGLKLMCLNLRSSRRCTSAVSLSYENCICVSVLNVEKSRITMDVLLDHYLQIKYVGTVKSKFE
jgi:hypothetical protein